MRQGERERAMCNVMCMLCLTEQEENCVALRCVHQQQQRASSSVASKLLYSALLYSAQFLPPSLRSHTLATPFPGSRCPSSTSFFFLFIDRHASLSIALFLSRAGRLSSGKRVRCRAFSCFDVCEGRRSSGISVVSSSFFSFLLFHVALAIFG